MSEPTPKLPPAAEALLADFPINEPDFEAQAQSIEARLAAAAQLAPRGDVLRAPELSPEPGEPGAPSSVRGSPAPKGTFAEMARRSVHKKDEEAAQLAKELLAATAQNRRPNQELVARVQAAGRATTTPLPLESAEEAARPSGVVSRAEAPVARAPTPIKPQPMHPGTIIGIAGTLVAIAACVALFLKSQPAPTPDGSAAAPVAALEKAEASRGDAPVPTPAASPKPQDVVSPEQLARAESPASKAQPSKPAGGEASSAAGTSKVGAAPTAVAQPAPVELEEDPEPQRPRTADAKPEPEPPLRPAEGSSGSVPLTPSAGAVSTALSAVRGGAQACLAGQSEPVSATITFAPDGHVLRVSAAGPAGSCIQAALSKARIAPFARETFSASTVVRPP